MNMKEYCELDTIRKDLVLKEEVKRRLNKEYEKNIGLYDSLIREEPENVRKTFLIWGSAFITALLVLGLIGLALFQKIGLLSLFLGFWGVVGGNIVVNYIGDKAISSYYFSLREKNKDLILEVENRLKNIMVDSHSLEDEIKKLEERKDILEKEDNKKNNSIEQEDIEQKNLMDSENDLVWVRKRKL